MNDTPLIDEETVYRRLLPGHWKWNAQESRHRPSSQAFADRYFKPSVDRATCCQPEDTQASAMNCVVEITAGEVRASWPEPPQRVVDVIPRPLDVNMAHCQIEVEPALHGSPFKRFIERLAHLSRWRIEPPPPA